jgi:hypothetical protein
MAHKPGKYLEELVAWIQQSVHEKALVIPNEKVLDIHTKKKRQIDISIRLSDGPTHLFVMVEVRDHKKPIDVRYIEEVCSKKQSVNANAASIVSRSGFTKTALEKAKHLGIQTLTYKEALKSDWSGWIKCDNLSVITREYDNVLITMGKENSNEILNVAPEILLQSQNNIKSKVLLDNDGKSIASFFDLAWSILNPSIEKLCEGLKPNGEKVRRSVMFNGILEPQLYVLGDDGVTHNITKVLVEADFYIKEQQYPFHISRFRNTEADESIAEVATANIEMGGKKIRVDLLVPYAGDYIPAGSKVQLRTTPLDNESQ